MFAANRLPIKGGFMTDQFSQSDTPSTWSREKIFCEIGRVLTSSLILEEVFDTVMKLIGDYFSPRNWSLLLIDKKTERLKFEIVMGVDDSKLDTVFLEKGEGIAGWVCETGQPAIVEDVTKDDRFSSRMDEMLGFATRSVVCVPILNGSNEVIGAIELINKIVPAPGGSSSESPPVFSDTIDVPFTMLDMEILSAIAAFTGIAAENAFLHQKIRDTI
jgi:GAF domain-containing protein